MSPTPLTALIPHHSAMADGSHRTALIGKQTSAARRWLVCLLCLLSLHAFGQGVPPRDNPEPNAPASPSPAPSAAPTEPPRINSSWGTGFVIGPGHLLTAYHVVQQRSQIRVGLVGGAGSGAARWVAAELIKSDPVLDLALLKIPENLPALKLHAPALVPIGLEVAVIGYPQPRIQGASRKITSGIVNGYRSESFRQPDSGLLQISAEVSQGNSGGPVFAPDGTVIGMVQKKLNVASVAQQTNDWLINVSYALRSSQIIAFLQSTDVAYQTQPLQLSVALRPYQLFEQFQQSVLPVVARMVTTDANNSAR